MTPTRERRVVGPRLLPAGRVAQRLLEHPLTDPLDHPALLGDRDELGRHHQAALRVIPAHQRLDARDAFVAEIHDGLIHDAQLVEVERAPQLVLGAPTRERAHPQVVVEDVVASATALLCAVHRRVGVAQQGVGLLMAVSQRDADAGGDELGARVEHERPCEAGGDPLGGGDRDPLARDLLEQQAELVAAEARDRVGRAHRLAQAGGDVDQEVVAGLVAERVVDLLEVVHVDEQDRRERARVPAHALERLLQAVGEEAAIRQAGEQVVQRAVLHRVLGFLALDRVREDVGDRDARS